MLLLEVGGPYGPAAAAAAAAGGWSSRIRDHQRRPHAGCVVIVHLDGQGGCRRAQGQHPVGPCWRRSGKASTAPAHELVINTSNTCHSSAHSGPVSPSSAHLAVNVPAARCLQLHVHLLHHRGHQLRRLIHGRLGAQHLQKWCFMAREIKDRRGYLLGYWEAAAAKQAVERDASNDSFCSPSPMRLQWLAARHTSTHQHARRAPVPQMRGSAGLPPSPCPRGQSARCCRGGPPGPAGCSRGSLQGREREGRVQVSTV